MLRVTIVGLLTIFAIEPALSADRPVARRGWHRTAVMLPAGLPRPGYKFRTTISYDVPYASRRAYVPRVYAYETPTVLFTPVYAEIPYVPVVIGVPLLPAVPTFAGYGLHYDVPYVGYRDRLPYACGVYGYC